MTAGETWTRPSPDASLQVTYGQRDDDRNIQGNALYRIGPFTTFAASASQFTGLQQVGLINNLQFLTYDPTSDQFVDRRTGLQFAQVPSPRCS